VLLFWSLKKEERELLPKPVQLELNIRSFFARAKNEPRKAPGIRLPFGSPRLRGKAGATTLLHPVFSLASAAG